MNYLIYIITNIPTIILIKDKHYNCKNKLLIETDEENLLLQVFPSQNYPYQSLTYFFDKKTPDNNKVTITKYDKNYKININLQSLNIIKQKEFQNCKIYFDNEYFLSYNNQTVNLNNLNNNYYDFNLEELNSNFLLIYGKHKVNETLNISFDNEKLDYCIYSKTSNSIVHFDSCNFYKKENNKISFYTKLYDQHKHILVVEYNISTSFSFDDYYSLYSLGKPLTLEKDHLIITAFFECILAENSNLCKYYLQDDLQEKISNINLRAMFNNFVKVDNLFLKNTNEINLIIKKDENFYEAKKYFIDINNGKISNIND